MTSLSNWSPPSVNIVRKPHILFISYYFPPMGGGGVQRILKFLKFWDYEQFQVSVLTVKPSYFYVEDQSLTQDLPPQPQVFRSGSLDPFRLMFILKKIFTPTRDRTSVTNRESGGFIRRWANFLFLPDSRILWLPLAVLKIWKIHRRQPIDLLLASLPPFSTGLIAKTAGKLFAIPYLLDFRDSWTDNPYLPVPTGLHKKIQTILEKNTIRRAAGCVFVNPALQDFYISKIPALKNIPSTVIRNGYDPDDFQVNGAEGQAAIENYLQIGVMGTVYSQGNAPLPLLEALTFIQQEEKEAGQKLRLVFIGKWVGEFLKKIKEHPYSHHISLINYLPHRQALAYAKSLDALALAVQSDLPGSAQVTPGRIYEYLYLQKPILAMCAPAGDLAWLIRECQAGEVVDYHHVSELVDVLKKWMKDPVAMKANYTFQNLEQFHRRLLTVEMMKFINRLLSTASSSSVSAKQS